MRAGGPVRRFQCRGDIGAGAEAWIDQAAIAQPLERFGIDVRALRLDQHRFVPLQPEPAQILEDRVDKLGPAAGRVEILDPDQEFATAFAGAGMARAPRCKRGPNATVRSAKGQSA